MVLNYQSNALKFMNKEKGKVLIIIQMIPGASRGPLIRQSEITTIQKKINEFYGFNIMETLQAEDDRDPYELLREEPDDKIVLSVLDNGIGIKDLDKTKLFKLFGCLKSTR